MSEIEELIPNNPVVQFKTFEKEIQILLMSDLHWDNPKADQALIKKDLNEARARGAKVFLNGDTFCAMQGKYDRRSSKSDVRPEHQTVKYLDALVNTAIDWFSPWADIILGVGYGNHETAILKHQETDLVERFVRGMNDRNNTDIQLGGYGGWIVIGFMKKGGKKKPDFITKSYKIKYHHGYGGGGPVTKGTIQFNRFATSIQGADMIWMGHVHEDHELPYIYETLDKEFRPVQKKLLMVRTPTYKEEYGDGTKGFHIEKGRPPKALGGRFLKLRMCNYKARKQGVGSQYIEAHTEPTVKH